MYKEQQPVLRGKGAVVAQETGVGFGAWGRKKRVGGWGIQEKVWGRSMSNNKPCRAALQQGNVGALLKNAAVVCLVR